MAGCPVTTFEKKEKKKDTIFGEKMEKNEKFHEKNDKLH